MSELTTKIADIETGIQGRLTEQGLDVRGYTVEDDLESVVRALPFAGIAFRGGRCSRVTSEKFRVEAVFLLTIVVRNVASEQARRQALYPLLMGALGILANKELTVSDPTERTVACTRLDPGRIAKVMDTDERQAWSLELQTSFVVSEMTDTDAADLLRIGLDYYLKAGDDTADGSDLVTLS